MKLTYVVGNIWIVLMSPPVFMAVPKPMRTEFGIHQRLESFAQKPSNKDEQNDRFCWPTFQLILMLGILIGGRFCAFTCPTWNFLIRNQQNLHIKENDQHPAQLLPNKLVNLFITVLLVSIRRSLGSDWQYIFAKEWWTSRKKIRVRNSFTGNDVILFQRNLAPDDSSSLLHFDFPPSPFVHWTQAVMTHLWWMKTPLFI